MAASFPDVSLEVNLHAKEGEKEKRAWPLFFLLSMVPCVSSRVTCASRSPLFAKNKAPKEETDAAVFAQTEKFKLINLVVLHELQHGECPHAQ